MRVVEVLSHLIVEGLDQDEADLLIASALNLQANYKAIAENLDNQTLECLLEILGDEAAERKEALRDDIANEREDDDA